MTLQKFVFNASPGFCGSLSSFSHNIVDLLLYLILNQSRRHGGFGGLSPSNKAPSLPKLKYETQ